MERFVNSFGYGRSRHTGWNPRSKFTWFFKWEWHRYQRLSWPKLRQASNMGGKYAEYQKQNTFPALDIHRSWVPNMLQNVVRKHPFSWFCWKPLYIFICFYLSMWPSYESTGRWRLKIPDFEKTVGHQVVCPSWCTSFNGALIINYRIIILCGFTTIKQVLDGISNDIDERVECWNQAYGLVSIGNENNDYFVERNGCKRLASLQSPDLNTGYALYESLHG